ncbi:hypothetical protein BJ170DRAFT_699874 [Xylariales sp. AK1849]|nr:hypothetical protein BJ170DRAFT_699874 [Xylariales sp. AK1849]
MRAWVYSSASGGLEHAIKLSDTTQQPLQKNEILVRVHSMSPNPADHKIPELGLISRAMIGSPATPGMDFAGTVEATGGLIDTFRVGEKVFGKVGAQQHGTLGEFVHAKFEGTASLPEGVNLEEASCVGTAGMTAYQTIAPNVKEGDKVFINGGSGGTGTFGIQIAKALGCHVTTSCSGKNVELCKDLGADEVIDYTKENVSEVLKSKGLVYKLVVDNVGSSPPDLYKVADQYLLPEGKFVQIGGGMSAADMAAMTSRMLLPSFLGGGKRKWEFLVEKNKHDDLVQIGKWMKDGKVKSVIDETFEFEDAPKAIEKLKLGRTRGNLVVRVSKQL